LDVTIKTREIVSNVEGHVRQRTQPVWLLVGVASLILLVASSCLGPVTPRLRSSRATHATNIKSSGTSTVALFIRASSSGTRTHARSMPRQQRTTKTTQRCAVNSGKSRTAAAAAAAEDSQQQHVENVVVIGSGPAGYTAGIYAGRASLSPVIFEGFQKGVPGGQLMSTTDVENFPGFPMGISGPELMERMKAQAERWGARTVLEDVESVDLSVRPFVIKGTETTLKAHSIILATGATAKRLNIPSEEQFWSRGISACAICDGASPIFKNKPVAVVGGGDTALEEALYLTKYASHVHLLIRTDTVKASKTMQDRVLEMDDITLHFNTQVLDALASKKTGQMEKLRLKNTVTLKELELDVSGMFYGIGHTPNTAILGGQVEVDNSGYVNIDKLQQTNVEGVFAAGDLHDTEWRQAITAAGSGCAAAIAAERYLVSKQLIEVSPFEAQEQQQAVQATKEAQLTATQPAETAAETAKAASTDKEKSIDLSKTKHKGQYALRKLYHESDRVLAVLYTSPTCGPCRALKPMLGRLVDEYEKEMHFVEIDIVKDQEIAEAAGVTGTPTVQFFKDKALVEVANGVKMKSDYREIVEKALASKSSAGSKEEKATKQTATASVSASKQTQSNNKS